MSKLLVFYLLFFSACGETGKITGSPDDPPDTTVLPCMNPKSSNTFNWDIDSIGEKESISNSIAGGIFAFSDSDAFAMGNFYRNGTIYAGAHWDGKNWIYFTRNSTIQIATYAVTGDSKRMVAVGGRFTALGGQQVLEFTKSDQKWKKTDFGINGNLYTVWTDGTGYYLAGGDQGGVLVEKESENAEWKIIGSPVDFYVDKITGITKSTIFLLGYTNLGGNQIWSRINGKWNLLYDQIRTDTTFTLNIPPKCEIADINILSCTQSNSIFLYLGTVPVKTFNVNNNGTEFTSSNNPFTSISQGELLNIFPLAKNDIWLTGNYLYHYNGQSLVKVSFTGNFSNFSAGIPFVTSSGKVFALLIAWDHALAIAQTKP